jgi:uncharacterized protein YutD
MVIPMIETEHGYFKIIKNHKDAFEVKAFNDRYVDYFDAFDYLVGDISAQVLRLRGFKSDEEKHIADYLMESAVPNAPFYILKRMNSETTEEPKPRIMEVE